ILEIADIIVVNKADRPGIENTVRSLRAMLDLGHRAERVLHHGRLVRGAETVRGTLPDENRSWQTPIVQTVAPDSSGIPELAAELKSHLDYLRESGTLRAREFARI